MNLVLEMESSLEFWRRIYPAGRSPHNPIALPQGEIACSKKDVLRLERSVWSGAQTKPIEFGRKGPGGGPARGLGSGRTVAQIQG